MKNNLLGKNITKYRMRLNLTQEALAEMTGVSNVFISQIETGARYPGLSTLIKLSQIFSISIDSLLVLETPHENKRYENILSLLKNKTDEELKLIEDVCIAICANTSDNKVVPKNQNGC